MEITRSRKALIEFSTNFVFNWKIPNIQFLSHSVSPPSKHVRIRTVYFLDGTPYEVDPFREKVTRRGCFLDSRVWITYPHQQTIFV